MEKFKEYHPDDLKHLQQLEIKILNEVISICESHDLKYYAYGGTAIGAIRHGGFIPWDDDIDIMMFRDDYEKLLKIMESELNEEYYVINSYTEEYYIATITHVCLKGTHFENFSDLKEYYDKGIFIDIFPLDNAPESKIKRKLQHYMWSILEHLLVNSIYNINTPNKILSIVHSLMHHILKVFPGHKWIKMKILKCITKYNKEKTNYITSFITQCGPTKFGKTGFFYKKDFEPSKKVKFEDIEINMPKNYDRILKTIYEDYMTLPPKEKRRNHAPDIIDFGKY